MITLMNATKGFSTETGRKVILDNVSLHIAPGASLGILGANGAGKSTLVRLLAGTELLDYGEIYRSGRISFPLGFSGTFHPHLTGRQNVAFLARLYRKDITESLEFSATFAELGAALDDRVETYSSGMHARLAFGVCLALDFDVYLIDEVTAVGDARFREKCLDEFGRRMERSDVIIVSHDEGTIRSWCDVAAVMHNGQLDLFGDVEAAIRQHHANVLHPEDFE